MNLAHSAVMFNQKGQNLSGRQEIKSERSDELRQDLPIDVEKSM